MWDEGEMREVEVEAPVRRTGARGLAAGLRAEVSGRGLVRARAGVDEVTRGTVPSVVYAPGTGSHGNFIDASYRRIVANPEWARRLTKAHTAKRQARATGVDEEVRAWRELDCATSSDALLMNVFCYPRVWTVGLRALLGVSGDGVTEFGYKPRTPLKRGLVDCTEVDMRVGDLLVEAKLTEGDFQFGAMRLVERYRDFEEVFERDALEVTRRGVRSYQLIRGVLAAHALGARFCVLCDARRPDLVEAWYGVMRAVRSFELQGRLRLVTWQEVAGCVPAALREFLAQKYGIVRS
jgi:hypothetical protein